MRLETDWTRCDGHGLCARLLPELVHLDEHGFPVLRGHHVPEDLAAHARRAVGACPVLALRLVTRPSARDSRRSSTGPTTPRLSPSPPRPVEPSDPPPTRSTL